MSVDTVTLEIVENTLRMVRHEMDAVMFRTSLSPMIRETHDTYPLVADRHGRMLVGQFGSYLASFLEEFDEPLNPGDVIVQNDPYLCGGSISHVPDVLVLRPMFHREELVGFTSQFGNLLDVGGRVFGSMSVGVRSIYEEGLRFPPVKLYDQGRLNTPLVRVLERNSRAPAEAAADLLALCSATAAGEQRVLELCDRFGRDAYLAACDALLERTRRSVRQLIVEKIPETPQSFEDFVDDDGQGNGPFRIKLTVWREGDHAVFDFDGTAEQAPGPINFYLHPGMMKMVIGVYLIMVFDPDILFNEGFYDLLDVRVEEGTILRPRYPAPLGNRHHTLARWIEVIAGALGQQVPETAAAAGYGSSPHMIYSGVDAEGETFGVVEILMGGIPARPAGDGMDAHSWYPQLENTPCEYQEIYYPLVTEESTIVRDSGGAGFHRGGCGVRKVFLYGSAGDVSVYDDR
ncbi:MAG: hydantoinase B/oxoprolinase family protein, partial [Gaiellales bacterium]